MATANHAIAKLFQEMADAMTLLGVDAFKVGAFQKVARSLELYEGDVAALGPDEKALTAIPGVGKGSAARIAEYLRTGKIKDHEELVAEMPPGLRGLMRLPGLGPKTVATLWRDGGVTGVDDLRQKLAGDGLAALPGLGAKKLENLRKALMFAEACGVRVRIGQAMTLARWFVEALRKMPGVRRADYAGSLRRGRETIGDLDLVAAAAPEDAEKVSAGFAALAPVSEVLARGPSKTTVCTAGVGAERVQIDLRVVAPESYGAALLYFTGSKEHNVALRERALRRGLRLNEYGVYEGDARRGGATEEEVYAALGLDWVPPELREDRGELEQAERHALPALLRVEDIRAELHAHTTASDGGWSIRELAEAAAARGFHTVAVTDHSKSQHQANGLTAARLERHIHDIRAVAHELRGRIRVLAGSEVDILKDGRLDYPDSLLKELDVVVASPHAALQQEPEAATARMLRAIENPYVTILGHPTGRLVNRRAGISPDMPALVKAAAARGVAMEINANHHRLDLRDTHARMALEAGVKLSINCDAHGPADLDQLLYGVLTARRAGATPGQVVNCLDAKGLEAWLASTRRG